MLNLTSLLKLYASRRQKQLQQQDYAATQRAQLRHLVNSAARTAFGQEHHFDSITTVADFQRNVRLRSYEDYWKEYWEPVFPRLENCTWPGLIRLFPVTSGTTSGTTKYIPYSNEMDRSNTKAGLDLLVHHINNRPHSRIFAGKTFMLGGSTELVEQAPGVFSGDLSGIAVKTMPWWARLRYFPPQSLALMSDWEEKIAVLAARSLREDISAISGVPSWMLIFFDKVFELRPEAGGVIAGAYPQLEMLIHGGVNFGPYRQQFEALLAGSGAELREVYPATEGFIATADRGSDQGLRMNLDHGVFFEFVPVEELGSEQPTRHWIETVEQGVNYAIVLTTCAGLWGYVLGDTVKFVDLNPPRLLITGRTSYCLSAFGEHLIAEEIDDAVTTAARSIGAAVTDYSAGALYPAQPSDLGGHLFVVEFADPTPAAPQLEIFAAQLDQRLQQRNEDYAAHRAEGFGLNPPEVAAVLPGTFTAWMKERGKLGGQHKVPRIISDQELFAGLRHFGRSRAVSC